MTVDLYPQILANVVDIQREHLLLHRPVSNKTSRLSSAIMFVRLYRLLLIRCIYMYQCKNPTCPDFSAWLNTGSIRPLKATEAIMLCSMRLPSKLCVALHGNLTLVQCVNASHAEVWNCQFWRKFLSRVDSNHGAGLSRNDSVISRSTLCPIERRSC